MASGAVLLLRCRCCFAALLLCFLAGVLAGCCRLPCFPFQFLYLFTSTQFAEYLFIISQHFAFCCAHSFLVSGRSAVSVAHVAGPLLGVCICIPFDRILLARFTRLICIFCMQVSFAITITLGHRTGPYHCLRRKKKNFRE